MLVRIRFSCEGRKTQNSSGSIRGPRVCHSHERTQEVPGQSTRWLCSLASRSPPASLSSQNWRRPYSREQNPGKAARRASSRCLSFKDAGCCPMTLRPASRWPNSSLTATAATERTAAFIFLGSSARNAGTWKEGGTDVGHNGQPPPTKAETKSFV